MKKWFKVFFLFFIFGLLVYSNSLNNKFLIDDYFFLRNPVLSNTKFILSQWDPYREQVLGVLDNNAMQGYYRPLQQMVLDYCYDVFKNNFWEYHLLNLFFFALASSLIYLLIGKISGSYNLAFFAGLFYLIHPINGIVVNYMSASVFPLEVIFMIGTILLLWESLERKNDRGLYFLSLLFSFLSLFWHESGVMTPLYITLVVVLFRRESTRTKTTYLFPYFLIILSYTVFRDIFLNVDRLVLNPMALYHMNVREYLASLFRIFSWYITRLFYPKGIVMTWATPIFHDHILLNVLGVFLFGILFLLLFIRFSKEKLCQLGLAWFLIGFIPVCLAAFRIRDNGAQIEPHWLIFSSIGFFILVAYFCIFVLDRTKKTGLILLSVIVVVWASVSHAYNQLWADEKTYALYWSQQVPNLRSPYFYLANAYKNEGAFKESRKYLRLALSGHSSDLEIYNNLGVMDQTEGHFKDAESDYKMALKVYPYSAGTYNNLAFVYLAEDQWDKAKGNFDRSLMYNPLLVEPRLGLASIFLKHAEYKQAIDLCFKNLDIKKNDPKTLLMLVDIFIRDKDFVNMKKYAYQIINDETDPVVLTELGIKMGENNFTDPAIDSFTKAIRMAPDYKEAYLAAGTFFANLDKFDEAIHIWKIGSSIDPSDQRFKKDIAKALALKLK